MMPRVNDGNPVPAGGGASWEQSDRSSVAVECVNNMTNNLLALVTHIAGHPSENSDLTVRFLMDRHFRGERIISINMKVRV